MKMFCVVLLLSSFSVFSQAKSVADIEFDDSVKITEASNELMLNGLAVRYKFFFKIYVAALYVEQVSQDAADVIRTDGHKRMHMHFLYDEVPQKKLVNGWLDGFEDNLSNDEYKLLKPRIDQFNQMFETVHKNDVIMLDYIPRQGTRVKIKGNVKGFVKGKDFNQALLKIWIGDSPVTEDVKAGLLGLDE